MKKLLRQELKSYTPECNAKCSIIIDLIVMVSSLSIGIILIYYSKKNTEIEIDYTNCIPNQENSFSPNNRTCKIQFKIQKKCKIQFLFIIN